MFWGVAAVFGLLTIVLLTALALFLATGVLNSEYGGRGRESLSVIETKDAPYTVAVYVHELRPDSNSATVSVVATPNDQEAVAFQQGGERCGYIRTLDRFQFEASVEKITPFPCHGEDGRPKFAVETGPFNVQLLPSLEGYPHDALRMSLIVQVLDKNGALLRTEQKVVKVTGPRAMRLIEHGPNWEVGFVRPDTEIVYIYLCSAMFIVSTLGVAFLVFRERMNSAGEGMLSIAGYLIAAAGFRSLLGFEKTAGVTIFELIVFGLPMLILVVAAAKAVVSSWMSRQHSGDAGENPSA